MSVVTQGITKNVRFYVAAAAASATRRKRRNEQSSSHLPALSPPALSIYRNRRNAPHIQGCLRAMWSQMACETQARGKGTSLMPHLSESYCCLDCGWIGEDSRNCEKCLSGTIWCLPSWINRKPAVSSAHEINASRNKYIKVNSHGLRVQTNR